MPHTAAMITPNWLSSYDNPHHSHHHSPHSTRRVVCPIPPPPLCQSTSHNTTQTTFSRWVVRIYLWCGMWVLFPSHTPWHHNKTRRHHTREKESAVWNKKNCKFWYLLIILYAYKHLSEDLNESKIYFQQKKQNTKQWAHLSPIFSDSKSVINTWILAVCVDSMRIVAEENNLIISSSSLLFFYHVSTN